jgi:NTE family protein
MTLSTLIHAGLTRPTKPLTALVLMGGGARTAYQAGALQAIGAMLALQTNGPSGGQSGGFPFQILVGTSAGALNASFLAGRAQSGLAAFESLQQFWGKLRSEHVYRLDVSPWVRISKVAAAWSLHQRTRKHGAVLDTMPLVDTLHRAIDLTGVEAALAAGALHALAVTASSYSSGTHWTFCHTKNDARSAPWQRPGRRAVYEPITIEHLMASSAIPLLFPATPLWVDSHREFFGDGSMRQISPLSPALHLGAHKILVIGVGQPERAGFAGLQGVDKYDSAAAPPSLGGIMGHAMASVFHDTLQSDVEQAKRMNDTLGQLPREVAGVLPYRSVQVMAMHPKASFDALAQTYAHTLPSATRNTLAGLGAMGQTPGESAGASLASYLLFESGFTQALIEQGQRDAYALKTELMAFFNA